MFILALGTALSILAFIGWTASAAIIAIEERHTIDDSILLTVPKPVTFLGTVLPLALLAEGGVFLILSLRRWKGAPHSVHWDVIPNHNIVVAMTAYNDEQSIASAVTEFKMQPDVKEVIVIDNNSLDKTSALASTAGARVVREEKQGYGFACIRGLNEALQVAKVNVVVLVEGDMTFSGKDLSKLIPYLDNVDMVVGTRTTQELTNDDSQLDWFYVWGNMFLAKMVQVKFFDVRHWGRVRLTDVGCTMRAIRADALRKMVEELSVGGHSFSPHMLMVAISKGLKVVEIPVTFRRRWGESKGAGAGKLKGLGIGLRMMWHILTF